MKLISMVDYVLEQKKEWENWEKSFDSNVSFWKCIKYANFLKQPLTLGMFVPCDENGNILEEPYHGMFEIKANEKCSGWKYLFKDKERPTEDSRYYDAVSYKKSKKQFEEAKKNVFFKGFELIEDELINNGVLFWVGKFNGNETVDSCISSNLTLTESAIKKVTV